MNDMAGKIREHMKVVASDGSHVGTVDRVEGDRIKLTRNDPGQSGASQSMGSGGSSQSMGGATQGPSGGAQGGHRYLPVSSVASVDGDTVRLSDMGDDDDDDEGGGADTPGAAVPE